MEDSYKQMIELSFLKASVYSSKLSNAIYFLDGMSGYMTRCFYNSLCSMRYVCYLQIESWKGSTICSTMYNNPHGKVLAIDNFCE